MGKQTGNLSPGERLTSVILGVALPALVLGKRHSVLRAVASAGAAALVARAMAGHCGLKAAVQGHSSLREGLWDQWKCIVSGGRSRADGLPGSPAHRNRSKSIDRAVDESFPASDPPATHRPDEPPANAAAKWAAARETR